MSSEVHMPNTRVTLRIPTIEYADKFEYSAPVIEVRTEHVTIDGMTVRMPDGRLLRLSPVMGKLYFKGKIQPVVDANGNVVMWEIDPEPDAVAIGEVRRVKAT